MSAYTPRHAPKAGEPVPPAVAAFRYFRGIVRQLLRKPAAVPAVCAGAAPAPAAERFPCCVHCLSGSPCEPQDNHLAPCAEGCGEVLGDAMLSQVREQWNAWHDDDRPSFTPARPVFTPSAAMTTGEFAVLDARVDAVLRPVNGRNLGTQPRRHPELNREFTDRPGRDVLERVIAGLRKLPVYGERPQLEVDKLYRNGWQ